MLKLATLSDREDEHVKKIALTILENLEGYINGDAKKQEVILMAILIMHFFKTFLF